MYTIKLVEKHIDILISVVFSLVGIMFLLSFNNE